MVSPRGFIRDLSRVAAVVLLLVLISGFARSAEAGRQVSAQVPGRQLGARPPQLQGPYVSPAARPHHLQVDLRTLRPQRPWRPGDPVHEVPLYELGPGGAGPGATSPGALKGTQVSRMPPGRGSPRPVKVVKPIDFSTPNPNFEGIAFTGFRPPDTNGDVGPNHYIQVVNAQFEIFDKAGNSLAGPLNINTLWAGFGGYCQNNNRGDPVTNYDHLADRWLISQFTGISGQSQYHQCIAVSATADPVAGGWNLYDFLMPAVNDYPKIAVWPDAYYMGTQRGFSSGGLDVFAFDRANMLNGNAATLQSFMVAAPSLFLMPSDLDGPPPPVGTPNSFIRHVDGDLWGGADRLEEFEFHVDWNNPALSTFTGPNALPTMGFSADCGGGNSLQQLCVSQPGTATRLESLAVWTMWRAAYRNFGTHETLMVNHTVDADGADHAGVRWYELRRAPGGAWTLFQQATFAPDGGNPGLADDPHRFMGSIAMDRDGDVALGYAASVDATDNARDVFPGIRYAGRIASDPVNTLPRGEFTIVAGAGSQTASNRYGDYSSMSVDPVDDCTFWYTQEYIPAGGNWRTRIAALRFDSCIPQISINDVSQAEGNMGTTPFAFTVSLSRPSAFATTVDYATADGTATVADNDYQPTSGTLTFQPGETSKTVTVVVNGDNKFELDENFFVNLSNPSNGTFGDGQGEGTILNDDPLPAVSISDDSQFEGNAGTTPFTFAVSLSNPSFQTITVDFATADGTATVADNDYQPATGTVVFNPGETTKTVTVLANGDVAVEPDETFFVNLSNPTNATIADGQGQGTILNDDLSPNVTCTITGTNKDDNLVGTPGDDVICGGNGDDTINGMGGNDVLLGENGKDLLIGGDGHDLLLGGNGVDSLLGGNGNDNLQGGNGGDSLTGGAGSDALFGENGPDFLDTQDAVSANDSADGGSSPDTCATDPGDFIVNCP
jgi:Ca2+-binding RTX toxin-like protein